MNEDQLQHVLKALADPNRRRILQLLAEQEEACMLKQASGVNCTMIAEQMSISQPTVSHHMKELMQAELIQMTPAGSATLLTLRSDTLNALFETLRQQFHLSNDAS